MRSMFGMSLQQQLMAGAAIVAVATASPAMAQTRQFNVPAQAASRGIPLFARQAGVQVIASGNVVGNRRTNAVRGSYSVQEGLRILLNGTGLVAEGGAGGIITIRAGQASGESQAGSAAADSESADAGATSEILVVGSPSQNVDIRRTENDAQPYVVLGREEIRQSQATTVEEFLRTRLPMNADGVSQSQLPGTFGARSTVNLRGLGFNQTLILVDGRRLPGISDTLVTGAVSQPDLNGIPLAAIERIEILPATASGIYGGGATGGVINIILRRDYSGGTVSAQYSDTTDFAMPGYRLDASFGFQLEGGRTRIMLSASRSGSGNLLEGERDFTRRGRELQLANNPAAILASFGPPPGFTTNIRSLAGTNLVLDNGTPLNSPYTFVPVGYAGPASDGGAAFVANAGRYNIAQRTGTDGGEQAALLVSPTRQSYMASVRRQFTDAIEAYGSVSFNRNVSNIPSGNGIGFVILPAGSPSNPFTTDILVTVPAPNLRQITRTELSALQFNTGAIARPFGDWSVSVDYGWNRSRSLNSSWQPALTPAGSAAITNGTLDIMRDVNAFPLDYSLYEAPRNNDISGPADVEQETISARASGSIISLPGGPLTVSALAERRVERAADSFRDTMARLGTPEAYYAPSRSQRVYSTYLEARFPIFGRQNARPGLRELEVQAAIRRDWYATNAPNSNFGIYLPSRDATLPQIARSTNEVASTDFTVGLRYVPMRGLLLRASYSTGFLPPSVAQIGQERSTSGVALIAADPRRGNVLGIIFPPVVLTGGNPNLVPERSKSWSIGAVLEPSFLPGFRLSVDYVNIAKTNEIGALTTQQIFDNEALLPGRIVRGPNLPGDLPGWAGPVIQFDSSLANLASSRVEAVDIQANYDFHFSNDAVLRLYSVATWQPTLRKRILPTSPDVNSVGFAALSPLEWRANVGATFEQGPWTAGINAQYLDSYRPYMATDSATVASTKILNQGSSTVPSQIYFDAFLRYRFVREGADASSILHGLEIQFGVQNVFNTSPPTIATLDRVGYSTYGDPRLRRFTFAVSKSF